MQLTNGDSFPEITGQTIGGETITIPTDLDHEWNVVMFYRGHW